MQPGWYPDPHGASDLRWWDGTAWTGQTTSAGDAPPPTTAGPAAGAPSSPATGPLPPPAATTSSPGDLPPPATAAPPPSGGSTSTVTATPSGEYPPPTTGTTSGDHPPPATGVPSGEYPPPTTGTTSGEHPPPTSGTTSGEYPPPATGVPSGGFPPPGAGAPSGGFTPPPSPQGDNRRTLLIGLVVLIVVLLGVGGVVLASTGGDGDDTDTASSTTTADDTATTTADDTTTTTADTTTTTAGTPAPNSDYVTSGGLTFTRLPEPWQDWTTEGNGRISELSGAAGQFVVVQEVAPSGGSWIGNLLIGDLTSQFSYTGEGDLPATTHALADTLIDNYYVEDAESSIVQETHVTIDGRPGYFIHHELTFSQEGLETTREKVIVAVIDTGRARPAAFWASIPYNRADLNEGMDAAYHSLQVND